MKCYFRTCKILLGPVCSKLGWFGYICTSVYFKTLENKTSIEPDTRPARGGGGKRGKIPGGRSAERGPEISVKCSYCLSSLYVCPK